MSRKTKADALETREGILDAAEQLFVRHGVSRTTLEHIACEAGVTRGAIYWHFDAKAAMFNAMMERAKMPLESAMRALDDADSTDPLGDLKNFAKLVFQLTECDPKSRCVFEIATLKIEYVDEFTAHKRLIISCPSIRLLRPLQSNAERPLAASSDQILIRAAVILEPM